MSNERLRSALTAAGMCPRDLADRVQVDVKTVERWISNGRSPHRRTRAAVAALLHADERHLWPDATPDHHVEASTQQEFVAFHPNRNAIPPQRWLDLAAGATEAIDIWAFAASFLHDSLDGFFDIVAERAAAGVNVRLLFGDPTSDAVRIRGIEEGLAEGFAGRCANSWIYLRPYLELPGIQSRRHRSTLYASIYRFDKTMLINTHTLGVPAARSPLLEIVQTRPGRVFHQYLSSLQTCWENAN